MSSTLSLLLVSLFSLGHVALGSVDSKSLLWPMPATVTELDSTVRALDPDKFYFSTSINSAILNQAFQRYTGLLFQTPAPYYPEGAEPEVKTVMPMLTVKVMGGDETLKPDTDESYTLNTQTGVLEAQTVFGALRGLETFSQLVYRNRVQEYLINNVMIKDSPRFQFRATMIDTSRHYLPVQVIYDHLDAMTYNKFNVLHWHIVDDQSFPYTSENFPNLTIAGAYDPQHVYSQKDIAAVIEFATFRGIRVIVEFDTPGHTQSWGLGQADLLTQCYKGDTPDGSYGPIDPTLDTTWTFLEAFFTEVAKVFPDEYIHLGGDEVSFLCWESNPKIQAWMKQNNYTDYSKLEQYYETRLLKMVAGLGKQYIVWQEIFDNGLQVLPDTVINVWKGGKYQDEMFNITKANLKVILSACWYLNYISYGADWKKYYVCDPQDFNGTDAQNQLVVGGEACMWAEYVDATNFLSRYWPRGGAVGERLWSTKENSNDINEAEGRLHYMRCRLVSRQIPAEPLQPSYCSFEWPGS